MDKGLVTRLSTIAAEKAKKTVTKIKAALAEEVIMKTGPVSRCNLSHVILTPGK